VASYRTARAVVIGNMVILVIAWAAFAFLPVEISSIDLVVSAVLALLTLPLLRAIPALMRAIVRPLAPATKEETARRQSVGTFVAAVGMTTAAVAWVPLISVVTGLVTRNPLAYAVPFLVGEYLLYRYVLPRPATIAAIRERLEAEGATSHLEAALRGQA
jgi:hypothetical protein